MSNACLPQIDSSTDGDGIAHLRADLKADPPSFNTGTDGDGIAHLREDRKAYHQEFNS